MTNASSPVVFERADGKFEFERVPRPVPLDLSAIRVNGRCSFMTGARLGVSELATTGKQVGVKARDVKGFRQLSRLTAVPLQKVCSLAAGNGDPSSTSLDVEDEGIFCCALDDAVENERRDPDEHAFWQDWKVLQATLSGPPGRAAFRTLIRGELHRSR